MKKFNVALAVCHLVAAVAYAADALKDSKTA